jgi:L-threonylcarbamoyladenylate synthase
MPDNEVALELLRRTGPLAVSSANRTGQPSPTAVDAAEEMLGESVLVYLDGGPTDGDTPSTILDVTADPPRVLREGAIELASLKEFDERVEVAS